jgi:hypothetical protein
MKYGPALQDAEEESTPETPDPIVPADVRETVRRLQAAEVAREVEDDDDLPVIAPKLGKAFTEPEELRQAEVPPPPVPETLPHTYGALVEEIRRLGPLAQRGEAAATARLNEVAEDEYNRSDGGRLPIKKRLAAYGIGRPNAEGDEGT